MASAAWGDVADGRASLDAELKHLAEESRDGVNLLMKQVLNVSAPLTVTYNHTSSQHQVREMNAAPVGAF